jgi:glycosyltransferase involved in cell wall biosynthesis
MACGTPVITSNTSSMPEIASDEAILINPGNADEIAEAMLSIENDEKLYLKNKQMGLARAQLFSWEKTAKELKNLYEKFER